jgi:hypothetical protein
MHRTLPVVGDRVFYHGSIDELHDFGNVEAVHTSPSGRVMVHVRIEPTLDRAGQLIRCRAESVDIVPTPERCDNCGTNTADVMPFTWPGQGTVWTYCVPCNDAARHA